MATKTASSKSESVFYVEPGQDPIKVEVVDGDPTGEGILIVKLPTSESEDGKTTYGGGEPAVQNTVNHNIGAAYWTAEDPAKTD